MKAVEGTLRNSRSEKNLGLSKQSMVQSEYSRAEKPLRQSGVSRAKESHTIASMKSCLNGNISPKFITTKQLKEIIQEIFASKKIYDEKCMKNSLPMETMEHHLFTFLSTRFGLKVVMVNISEPRNGVG